MKFLCLHILKREYFEVWAKLETDVQRPQLLRYGWIQLIGASAVRCKTSCEPCTNVLAGLCYHNTRNTIQLMVDENNQKVQK